MLYNTDNVRISNYNLYIDMSILSSFSLSLYFLIPLLQVEILLFAQPINLDEKVGFYLCKA